MRSAFREHPVSRWFLRHKERIGLIAIGHTGKRIEEFLFDWLLYGVVVTQSTLWWGSVWGAVGAFLIMMPLSALVCYLYIRFYDWAKKDWLGLETLEELRESEAKAHWLVRHIIRWAKRGDAAMFFVLSFWGDPFITTVYFRRGSHLYNGLSTRDWKIFFASVVVSNAYWTLRWSVIVALALYLWQLVSPYFS
jgi:hypothetical protein